LHPRRIVIIVIASVGLGCLSLLGGLYLLDAFKVESQTTGTQVQLTPTDKADIEAMRATMKQRQK
jgi:hypothetical protein